MAHFAIPSHILVGKDALPSAVPYLKTYGNRAFIVTGKHVGKSPMMEQLKKTLEKAEIAYYVFDGITGEPTDKMIEEGLEQYKKTGCQFVIGIRKVTANPDIYKVLSYTYKSKENHSYDIKLDTTYLYHQW